MHLGDGRNQNTTCFMRQSTSGAQAKGYQTQKTGSDPNTLANIKTEQRLSNTLNISIWSRTELTGGTLQSSRLSVKWATKLAHPEVGLFLARFMLWNRHRGPVRTQEAVGMLRHWPPTWTEIQCPVACSHNHVLQQSEQVGRATREVSLEMIIPADMGRHFGGKKVQKINN